VKSQLKSALFFLLYYSGIEYLLAKLVRTNASAIIMYHGICEDSPLPEEIDFHLPSRDFAAQIRALSSRYSICRLNEVAASIKAGEAVQQSLVLTFDDGYKNNLVAAEILKKLNAPWTIYLNTDFIGSGDWIPLNKVYWSWDQETISAEQMWELRKAVRSTPAKQRPALIRERVPHTPSKPNGEEAFVMLDWSDVKKLKDGGVEIGAHTARHCNMTVETPADCVAEIRESKEAIERNVGKQAMSFAYPYGLYNDASKEQVAAAGFTCAVSTNYGLADANSDLYALPRIGYDNRTWYFCCQIALEFLKHALRGKNQAKTPAAGRSTSAHG
jgi:peptidoglycan/xylan/chitin deacetylase (PgdA/CDA1 family)